MEHTNLSCLHPIHLYQHRKIMLNWTWKPRLLYLESFFSLVVRFTIHSKTVLAKVSARIQRWAITLGAYSYHIVYKSGKDHAKGDD